MVNEGKYTVRPMDASCLASRPQVCKADLPTRSEYFSYWSLRTGRRGAENAPLGKLTWLAGKWTWIEDVFKYSLLKMRIFQPAMLVYWRVHHSS